MTEKVPTVGSTWKPNLGGKPQTVVAVEPPFVTVKNADSPKKELQNPMGGQLTTISEMQEWTEIQ
jgi:hypothetical protein